jgi:hypothetical protein
MHKKIVKLAFYIAAFAMCANAQNTFQTSVNVGIVTTSPQARN